MHQRIEYSYDCTPERFWAIFLDDEAYNRGLHEHLGIAVEHLEVTDDGPLVRRSLHLRPNRKLPGFLEKIMGGAREVRERSVYDPARHRLDVIMELPVIGRRSSFVASYTSEPLSGGGFTRVWEADLEVRLPVVGRRIERYILQETADSMARADAFTRQWLAEREGGAEEGS